MADTPVDLPLGYAEFRFRGKDGEGALTAKAYTYADLAKIVGLKSRHDLLDTYLTYPLD